MTPDPFERPFSNSVTATPDANGSIVLSGGGSGTGRAAGNVKIEYDYDHPDSILGYGDGLETGYYNDSSNWTQTYGVNGSMPVSATTFCICSET